MISYFSYSFRVDLYIGETTTSLSRRLTMHLQNGIRKHFNEKHQEALTRNILESNTKILKEINTDSIF